VFGDMEEGKRRKKWCKTECMEEGSLAKFIVPDWGDKVDHGIGLSYRPAAGLHRLEGRYDNPMPESTLSPHSGTMNLATGKEEDEEVP
jgi:hypothetical protein